MQSFFLSWRSSRIHYLRGGGGKKLLLCFHGYGESAQSFAFLEEALAVEYTLLAIDLPFHGATDWKEGFIFTPEDLLQIIRMITPGRFPRAEWQALGYSMGGRVALSLVEKNPEKIAKLTLLAPDGLRMNPWYWLATQTPGGRRLFRFTMRKPGWFFLLLRAANTCGLVNRSIFKFIVTYIGDPGVRQDLYARWMTMRCFKPEIPVLQSLARERGLAVRLLYGHFDRIIRVRRGEIFRKRVGPSCRLSVLPSGHHLLHPKNLDSILLAVKE